MGEIDNCVALGVVIGFVLGALCVAVVWHIKLRPVRDLLATVAKSPLAALLVLKHAKPFNADTINIAERQFPIRVRADLQRAIENLFDSDIEVSHFCGIQKEHDFIGISLSDCIVPSEHYPTVSAPPQYEDVDVGEAEPVRCLKNGLWLLQQGDCKFVMLLTPSGSMGQITGARVQIGTPNIAEGTQIGRELFRRLEESVRRATCYRGKILSLEVQEHSYSGKSTGILVHKLNTVERDQVILPQPTLALLDRNVLGFVEQRAQLSKFNQSTKKGLLFYGPPGTGKTHTIHYLAGALKGHSTLLITAEQVGQFGEYMTLARLLQPSLVVMEDVDLVARDRTQMGVCEEVVLNKLLNEMDGLREDAEILFLLTTNRPEALETALSSRPGRIDQAIEFPLPDEAGRKKLVRLYSQNVRIAEEVVEETVKRTDKVSAAFIKELMRRSVQFHLERDGQGDLAVTDVGQALEEMLFSGGALNLKLLGAEGARQLQ